MKALPLKIGLQQRVLAGYRVPFFEMLAEQYEAGLGLFSGDARPGEMIQVGIRMEHAHLTHARNWHILSGKFYLCWQAGIVQWLQKWNPDVLILEANPRYISQNSAVKWMHQKNRPVIGWGLGMPSSAGILGRIQSPFRYRFISQFDALITYSQTGAASYREAGIPNEHIFVACNAVSARPRQPLLLRPPEYPNGQATVLFLGRLQARKRLDLLMRACAALPLENQPDLKIVGDGPEREHLQGLAQQLYPRTEFLGARFGSELGEIFKSADLFVLPGTGGLALQEAMSFGLPVMAAEADGTQADLVRPNNGWVLPPGDQEALNRLLQQALANPARLREMGRESYRIVSEEINLEKMVDVFSQAVQFVWETGRRK